MYIPKQYQNKNAQDIATFIKTYSFGILVNQTDGKFWATHIPLELESDASGNLILQGHISKANPQWKGFAENDQVLAIFSGPHGYVSSSWYDYEEVPTWNYSAVHVYGRIRTIKGDELLAHLTRLVDKYEASSEQPVSVTGFSKRTMQQIRGIVGFEIAINDIQAIRKLSQTQSNKNFNAIIIALEQKGTPGDQALASDMKNCPMNP